MEKTTDRNKAILCAVVAVLAGGGLVWGLRQGEPQTEAKENPVRVFRGDIIVYQRLAVEPSGEGVSVLSPYRGKIAQVRMAGGGYYWRTAEGEPWDLCAFGCRAYCRFPGKFPWAPVIRMEVRGE